MSDSTSGSDIEATLYDPPAEHAEASEAEEGQEELDLEIPAELAHQLLDVAKHLGLNPSIVASRAVGLICDEIGLVEGGDLTSGALIQKYQTRLDLLHSLEYDMTEEGGEEPNEEEFGWDAVDQIIQQGKEAQDENGEQKESDNPGREEAQSEDDEEDPSTAP